MNHSLADLEREHGVKARVAGHKVSLNYDQIEARDSDLLAQECRGLVLMTAEPMVGSIPVDHPLGSTKILARPFNRFFNLGQEAAAPVDFNCPKLRFYEKLDGTLTLLYFDPVLDSWCVATRSVADADLPIDGFGEFTFRTLFEKACLDTTGFTFAQFVTSLDPHVTYIFELTTPLNRIVVGYDSYRITVLGARDNPSGVELDPIVISDRIKVPHAPIYRLGSIEEMVDFVSSRNPQEHEGVVVCDGAYRRVKVKNPGYLALNKVRDSVMNSPRGLVELILLDKLDDALPLFPENIVKRAEDLRDAFPKLLAAYRDAYAACKVQADAEAPIFNPDSPALLRDHRKAFALSVQAKGGWMAPMMDQYQGKTTDLVDWLRKKRNVDGGWANGFLDMVLDQLEKHS